MDYKFCLIFICTAFIVFSGNNVVAQCPPGDVNIYDQDDIDAFAAEYPNCTQLNGTLEIDPGLQGEIVSLAFFESVTSISGDFRVERDHTFINAFSNLQLIGGDLEFSYIDGTADEEVLVIPSSIVSLGGRLRVSHSDSLVVSGMEGVIEMTDMLSISNSNHIDFNALSNLVSMTWIDISSSSNIHFSGLTALETISENININSNSSGQIDFGGLASLQSIDSYFRIIGCDDGELTILNLDIANAINEVIVHGSDALISFSSCFFGNQIGSVNINNSNVTDIGFFAGVEGVSGDVNIRYGLQELQSVQALEDLIHVGGNFHLEDAPSLTSFNGPSSVLEIEGELILSELGLEITGGASTDDGFASLISVGGDITISEMPNIQGLTEIGFWQLQNVGGSSIGIYNTGAVQISALQNLVNFNGTLVLAFNPQMALCNIPFTCMFPQQVAFNMNGQEAFGCQDGGQINCLDFGQIQGQVFADFNCDNVMNGEDVGIPIHQLMSEESLLGFTNSEGVYEIDLSYGDYESFTAASLFGFENGNSYNFTGDGSIHVHDFPMCPTDSEVSNLSVSISPIANPPMPGFTNQYEVCVANLGSENASGSLSFEIPDFNGVTIVDGESGTVDEISVSWTVEELGPFESECFVVSVQIDTGTLGQLFDCVGTIESEGGVADDDPSNNTYTLQQTIIGSYDPNDKLVNHELIDISNYENDSLFALEYLIRFQNTGTAPATFVRVTDLLPEELDPSTLEMIHASHEYEISFEPENDVLDTPPKLEWFFDDINLPDSTTNEPESHGFIHFRINTYPNINPGDVIENFVSIFFDYNEEVITEDAVTEFVECDSNALSIDAPIEICSGDTVMLTATPAGFEEYTWDVDGNTYSGQQIQVPLLEEGTIVLEVSNPFCTLNTTAEITVNPQPQMSLLLGPYISCDSVMEVGVMATGEVSWYLADSLVTIGDPVMLNKSGFYDLVCENSCGVLESTIEVILHNLTVDAPTEACAGENVTIQAQAEGYENFDWIIEDEPYSGQEVEVAISGDGQVDLAASSPYCSSQNVSIQIEVLEQPYLNMILEPWLGCFGEVEIDLEPNGEVTWYLEDDLVASGNPVTIFNSGLYDVTVENECGMIENNVDVEVYDIPDEVTLTLDGDQLIVSPEGSDYVWLLEGLPVSTEGPAYTPTESGDYTVIVYFEGSVCSQTSNMIFVPVSIEEALAAQIQLFPNPAREVSTLSLPQGSWQISLVDSRGKIIQGFENVTATQLDIDLSNLSQGIYLVNVWSNNGAIVKKLVVD